MREITSIYDVTFEDMLEVLQLWESGAFHYAEVHDWAERIMDSGWHQYPNDNPRAILAQVIHLLANMYTEPILRKDIPILRQILEQAETTTDESWSGLTRFIDTTPWDYRRQQASANIDKFRDPLLDTVTDT